MENKSDASVAKYSIILVSAIISFIKRIVISILLALSRYLETILEFIYMKKENHLGDNHKQDFLQSLH